MDCGTLRSLCSEGSHVRGNKLSSMVVSVSRSAEHNFSKESRPSIVLVEGLGVEGDAHSGTTVLHLSRVRADPTQPNHRQVHLIHAELFEELALKGFAVHLWRRTPPIAHGDTDRARRRSQVAASIATASSPAMRARIPKGDPAAPSGLPAAEAEAAAAETRTAPPCWCPAPDPAGINSSAACRATMKSAPPISIRAALRDPSRQSGSTQGRHMNAIASISPHCHQTPECCPAIHRWTPADAKAPPAQARG